MYSGMKQEGCSLTIFESLRKWGIVNRLFRTLRPKSKFKRYLVICIRCAEKNRRKGNDFFRLRQKIVQFKITSFPGLFRDSLGNPPLPLENAHVGKMSDLLQRGRRIHRLHAGHVRPPELRRSRGVAGSCKAEEFLQSGHHLLPLWWPRVYLKVQQSNNINVVFLSLLLFI